MAFAAMLAVHATVLPLSALGQGTPDPKASLANGERAARGKDWATAATEFEAANKAQPSADALEGLANARYQQKSDADAYAAYDEWLKTYAARAPRPKKAAVEARLKELGDRTGLLAVEVSEPGATITVDDRPRGPAPLAAPLRLAHGPHRVRIEKEGFRSADLVSNVTPGATVTLTAKLEVQTSKGRLSIREKSGRPIRVLVDGVDVGEAPWTGEVEAGPHEVGGRGVTLSAAPEKITVERGKTRDVELSAASATLKVSTSDGKGLIYLDGKLVGDGTFASEVSAGPHVLRITRDGYDPFEEPIDLKEKDTLARSITLNLASRIETGTLQRENRPLEGIYGGFGLLMTFLPGGMHDSMQTLCASGDKPAELTSCSGEGGIGGGVTGFFGYHWDPVGVELVAGAHYDQSSPTLTWGPSSTDPAIGPDPARTEDFKVRRIGGFGIFRIRLTMQGEKIRFSVAGGVGLSYRSMVMTRDTIATDNAQFREVFVPDAQSYLSPVVSLEPSIQYRLGARTAIALGLSLLVESPRAFDQTPTTPLEGSHTLGPSGLNTPAYALATGTQVFLGPFIGMMFGP